VLEPRRPRQRNMAGWEDPGAQLAQRQAPAGEVGVGGQVTSSSTSLPSWSRPCVTPADRSDASLDLQLESALEQLEKSKGQKPCFHGHRRFRWDRRGGGSALPVGGHGSSERIAAAGRAQSQQGFAFAGRSLLRDAVRPSGFCPVSPLTEAGSAKFGVGSHAVPTLDVRLTMITQLSTCCLSSRYLLGRTWASHHAPSGVYPCRLSGHVHMASAGGIVSARSLWSVGKWFP